MTRWILRLLLLQVLLSALAAIRGLLPGCGACGGVVLSDFVTGMSGALFYSLLLWTVLTQGVTPFVILGMGTACGVHITLLIKMLSDHSFCLWCLTAALGAFSLLILFLWRLPQWRLRVLWPVLAALAMTSLAAFMGRTQPPTDHPIRIIVYEKKECPYCWELKSDLLPAILRDYPDRLSVEYRAAETVEWVQRTPTLVIDDGSEPEIMEGLPSLSYLRHRIELRIPHGERNP